MFSTRLAEIVLIVNDVRAAAHFYRDEVGLARESEADDSWAWFWASQSGQAQRLALHKGMLLFEEQSPPPASEHWGQVHYAFHVPRERLDAAVERVRSRSVDV